MNFKIKHNITIFKLFLKIVDELNKINIVPIIYGSLGLYLVIGEKEIINDLDFILTDNDFKKILATD